MGLNLKVVLTWEIGAERGMGIWGWRWGSGGGDGDLEGGHRDLEGGDGDMGGGDGDMGVEKGIWGWGSLPILPSKESSGREWRGNWYCRGTRTL